MHMKRIFIFAEIIGLLMVLSASGLELFREKELASVVNNTRLDRLSAEVHMVLSKQDLYHFRQSLPSDVRAEFESLGNISTNEGLVEIVKRMKSATLGEKAKLERLTKYARTLRDRVKAFEAAKDQMFRSGEKQFYVSHRERMVADDRKIIFIIGSILLAIGRAYELLSKKR
jgi:hypothetical protein